MNLTSYLLLITHYFAREVRALGEFNLPSSIPSLLVRNAGLDYHLPPVPELLVKDREWMDRLLKEQGIRQDDDDNV
ncbi:MAG: hypothetical protein ACSI46_04855 [Gloeotrichia echinulata DVL01]|jgi:hypothetical protein|nr:hypothetical protein [Gloeotrichia echinulata DEX184]